MKRYILRRLMPSRERHFRVRAKKLRIATRISQSKTPSAQLLRPKNVTLSQGAKQSPINVRYTPRAGQAIAWPLRDYAYCGWTS